MNLKRKIIVMILVILQLSALVSCSAPPEAVDEGNSASGDPNPIEDTTPVDYNANNNPAEALADTVDEQNASIIAAAADKHIDETIESTDGKQLIINADTELNGIETVSAYEYILVAVTDDFRSNLFTAYFGNRAFDAEYDERNDLWTLANSSAVGDYYLYDTTYSLTGETIPGEESFYIEYREPDLYPFEDNLLDSVSDSSVSISVGDAVEMCNHIIEKIAEADAFTVDYIYVYGTNGRRPYYKIVYKRVLDGMLVTSYNDIYFLVDNDGIEKIFGSLFDTKKIKLRNQIISLDTAIASLRDNATLIDFYEHNATSIGKITLEYIVTKTLTGEASVVPAWRFWIGSNEDEMNLNRGKVIAVDAITGELIQGERGNTF